MNKKTTQTILVTGAAGFIGAALCARLLREGHRVIGLDEMNAYYDMALKQARLQRLQSSPAFSFIQASVADKPALMQLFEQQKPAIVFHLAAQAGVRYALEAPDEYGQSNLVGTLNILEACRHHRPAHLLFASSSSVYGANRKVPFAENDTADHPISLYAATKRSGEMMAHAYAHLFDIPTTALRFFTVYGPWGRPDMAIYKFALAMQKHQPLTLYAKGTLQRDFTYIDDVIEALMRLMPLAPQSTQPQNNINNLSLDVGAGPYRVLNIGKRSPDRVLDVIAHLEAALGMKASISHEPLPAGDVTITAADTARLQALTGFQPQTPLQEGIEHFARWFMDYHGVCS